MSDTFERELGWEDEIEKESEYTLLPEGDYDFTIISFERGRHNGSEKLPPCNKATVKIQIESPNGSTVISHNLFLHTITEGMLSAFFIAIGQKRHGESIRMNWNKVVGAKGRCKVGVKTWDGKQYNEIKKFYEPAESPTQQGASFAPGRF